MGPWWWNVTVVGAILCLFYGWFLGSVDRSQPPFVRRTGLLIYMTGLMVLAGMAVVGPRYESVKSVVVNHSGERSTAERDPKMDAKLKSLISVASRTTKEVGRRPSKDHVAYEGQHGDLMWLTSAEYARMMNVRNSRQSKGP